MAKSTVVPLELPSEFLPGPLTEVIQAGARDLLRAAIQAEGSAFIGEHAHLLNDEGLQRLVRHGFLPERELMTGIGVVPVQVPRVRDRGSNADGSRIKFRSAVSAQGEVSRRPAALAVPEGGLDRRLRRGAGGASGA